MSTRTDEEVGTTTAAPARAWVPFAATTAAGTGALGLLATVDPNQPGHYPTCPFLWLTGLVGPGLWCPGCGSLRAVHDLLHLDLAGALARNPLAVLLAPVLLYAWGAWAWRLSGRPAPAVGHAGPRVIYGFFAVVLAFWVLRNVPGMTWLSLA